MWSPTSNIWLAQPVSEFFDPDLVQRFTLGTMVQGVHPFWGSGEFVYGKAGVATLFVGRLQQSDENSVFTEVPNTPNLGRPVYTNIYPMALNEFGWFQCVGMMIFHATASVAADTAFGQTAVGQVGPSAAGQQILGARNRLPSTTTVVKTNCTVRSGSNVVEVPNGTTDWFHGVTLSGTGIPASSEITALNPNRREVVMMLNATASGVVTVTGTYTDFIVAHCNRPSLQGRIT